MTDQRLSGDAPRDRGTAPESATGDPKGSRTPPVGAANERRRPIKIETPPLSFGSHPYPGGTLYPLQMGPTDFLGPIWPSGGPFSITTLCVCGYTYGDHLFPRGVDVLSCPNFRPTPPPFGTPISPEGPLSGTGSHPPVQSVSDMTDQEVDDLHAHLCDITGVHPCDPTDPRPIWEQGLAGPIQPERGTRLFRGVYYTFMTALALTALAWVLLLGHGAMALISWVRR